MHEAATIEAIIAKMNDAFYWVFGFIAIYVNGKMW